jgi:hypothetical protein
MITVYFSASLGQLSLPFEVVIRQRNQHHGPDLLHLDL